METFSTTDPVLDDTSNRPSDADPLSEARATLAPVEAASRLGVTRSRIYALVWQGELDDAGGQTLRVTAASVERRLAANTLVGEPIKPFGAWAILALASSDAAFRAHIGQRLSRWEQSRAKRRLEQRGLVELVPRLRPRGVARSYTASAEAQFVVLADPRTVLAGASAAGHLGWLLPAGIWPVEIYVPEADLANLIETHSLEMAAAGAADILVRAVPETWPFPPHLRVAPEIVAALDLAESTSTSLAELGRARLDELSAGIEPSWQQRPQRRRLLRASVPSSKHALRVLPRRHGTPAATAVWDDQAERDARGLVALLHVAGCKRRVELSEAMRISSGRLDRACAFLHVSPPHGLVLVESGELLELASAPDCGPLIERVLNKPAPEPLSRAALEVLPIVAYEQPVTRSDISHIRATDSSGVVETLHARGLIEDDPRFGGRGRPSFLVTTAAFLCALGLDSIAELPPLPGLPADNGTANDSDKL